MIDRGVFNELDNGYQYAVQTVLDNKEEELDLQFADELRKVNDSYIARMMKISQSNYAYNDRNRIEAEELRLFNIKKDEIAQKKQTRLMEETQSDRERLESIYFNELGRDGTLRNIEAMESATRAAETQENISYSFNTKGSNTPPKGDLSEQFEQREIEPKRMMKKQSFRVNAQDITENNALFAPSNNIDDHTPPDGFEP